MVKCFKIIKIEKVCVLSEANTECFTVHIYACTYINYCLKRSSSKIWIIIIKNTGRLKIHLSNY